jgi:hypothetical protein
MFLAKIIFCTDFSFHSIGVILNRLGQRAGLLHFVIDLVGMKKFLRLTHKGRSRRLVNIAKAHFLEAGGRMLLQMLKGGLNNHPSANILGAAENPG